MSPAANCRTLPNRPQYRSGQPHKATGAVDLPDSHCPQTVHSARSRRMAQRLRPTSQASLMI